MSAFEKVARGRARSREVFVFQHREFQAADVSSPARLGLDFWRTGAKLAPVREPARISEGVA